MKCESCGSSKVHRFSVRPELDYDCCKSCGHCLKVPNRDLSLDFETAQATYFGEGTLLVSERVDFFEQEVLDQRKRMIQRYLPEGALVTEVGPGSGFFAEWLRSQGYGVQLAEHSEVLGSFLAAKLDVKVFVGDFLPGAFQLITGGAFCSFHVVEHVADPVSHLAAGRETVCPGGFAFVATPNSRSWQQRLFRRLSPNFDSAHLRVFSVASLCEACEQAGWTVEATFTPEYTSAWLRVATKAIRLIRRQNEERTAGSYAASTAKYGRLLYLIWLVMSPLRFLQSKAGGGNEIFVVLRNPG